MANELIKVLIDRNREDIMHRLPKYLSPEQFFSLCYALDRNQRLAQAAQRNPEGLLAAILRAADCGLVIGSAYDHCTLIPYETKSGGVDIQLSIGYRGLIYQLFRAGAIIKATATCVYDGDDFQLELGDQETLIHRPALNDQRRADPRWLFDKRNLKGAYAIAWLPLAPLKHHRWCFIGEIERARLNSKIPDGPAWTHHYPAMACKTAVRRLSKLIEVCGETPENREAWERYGRTVELENAEYRKLDDDDHDEPDDLPGVNPGKLSPTSGKAAESASTVPTSAKKVAPPPPPAETRKRPVAPAPPPPPPPPEEEPPPEAAAPTENGEPISLDLQDELVELGAAAGMKSSALKKFVSEIYSGKDMSQLTRNQGEQLAKDLRQRAAQ